MRAPSIGVRSYITTFGILLDWRSYWASAPPSMTSSLPVM
jgi:hypothetical protein